MPAEGVKVKIVDEAEQLARAEISPARSARSGDNISPGYYRMPEATAETIQEGWLHTGDVGYLDDDGYLFIVERKKDLIIRGGFNVYPKDVEEVLAAHPAVQECAVVGVPDPVMGEEVCAYRGQEVGSPSERGRAHRSIADLGLRKYKTPKHVEFVEALPKTSIGKIQKKELRKLAQSLMGKAPQ